MKYCDYIWNKHGKYINMNTNKSMFGPVVLEVACGDNIRFSTETWREEHFKALNFIMSCMRYKQMQDTSFSDFYLMVMTF